MEKNEELENLKSKLDFMAISPGRKISRSALYEAADKAGRYFFKSLAALTRLAGSGVIAYKRPNCPGEESWRRYSMMAMNKEEGDFFLRHIKQCRLCSSREEFVVKLLEARDAAVRLDRKSADLLFDRLWRLAGKVIDSVEIVEEE